jgi:hypothetical protein
MDRSPTTSDVARSRPESSRSSVSLWAARSGPRFARIPVGFTCRSSHQLNIVIANRQGPIDARRHSDLRGIERTRFSYRVRNSQPRQATGLASLDRVPCTARAIDERGGYRIPTLIARCRRRRRGDCRQRHTDARDRQRRVTTAAHRRLRRGRHETNFDWAERTKMSNASRL